MALTINQGAGLLGFFISRESREIVQSMKLAYESTSTPDGYNSRLDQLLYMPVLCNSSSVRDVENWLYLAARSILDPKTNIFNRQLINLRHITNSPPRPTVKGYIRIAWTAAGTHQIIVLNDEQITIKVKVAGIAGSQLFQMDWANYGFHVIEDDGINFTGISPAGRNLPINSSRAYAVDEILSVRFVTSPMGTSGRSDSLIRIGKSKVINKLGMQTSILTMDLEIALALSAGMYTEDDQLP